MSCDALTTFSACLWPRTLSGASSGNFSGELGRRDAARPQHDAGPDRHAPPRRHRALRAVSSTSRAVGCPTARTRRRTFAALITTPRRPAGIPNFAPGATTRTSHATASCIPAAECDAVHGCDHRCRVVDDRVEEILERGSERVATAVLEATGLGVGCAAARGRRPRRTHDPRCPRSRLRPGPRCSRTSRAARRRARR